MNAGPVNHQGIRFGFLYRYMQNRWIDKVCPSMSGEERDSFIRESRSLTYTQYKRGIIGLITGGLAGCVAGTAFLGSALLGALIGAAGTAYLLILPLLPKAASLTFRLLKRIYLGIPFKSAENKN